MAYDLTFTIIGKLLLAAVLGGLVGLERELRRKPAGLRTNMFMCVGSALFTILSDELAHRFGIGDHTRIAAQLIPGIGFIGAGAILRERGSVVGLTTAATIFVIASVGMAVGGGLYLVAVFTVLLILVALSALGWFEDRFGLKTRLMTFRLTTTEMQATMARAHQVLAEIKIQMQRCQVHRLGGEFTVEFDADVSHTQQQQLLERLGAHELHCEVAPVESQRE